MKRDAGASLLWMVLTIVVLAYGVLLGVRVMPSVTEYWAVQKLVSKVSRMDSDEQARQAFDAEARLLGIRSVRGSDLDIQDGGGAQICFVWTGPLGAALPRSFFLMPVVPRICFSVSTHVI